MKIALTKIIMAFLSVKSAMTEEELHKLRTVIGSDWVKLTEACELRNAGMKFSRILEYAIKGEI